uniref:AlNc14C306G10443 protein n=1 Tax=Albugo laibachii Nc14 TaxID=890382 RepID=F0WVY2_9STRA|nr:AlNc14C306G10443 [Albugo laibachii Nc14]|eukprot:CCA25584.1 AlNc14C306G10443 [Albugo laibachii Nc14]
MQPVEAAFIDDTALTYANSIEKIQAACQLQILLSCTKNRKILFKTGVTTQERVVKICNETATVSPFTNVEGIVRIYPLRFAKHTKDCAVD